MTSKSIKVIIGPIEGTHAKDGKTVQNIIYGYSGNPLRPYTSGDDPEYCIFSVVDTSGVETGYMFINDEIDGKRIHKRLVEFINNDGSKNKKLFYRDKRLDHRVRTNENVELLDLLMSFRLKMTPDDAKRIHAKLIDKRATRSFNDYTVYVYDLQWDNIAYDGKLQSHKFIGNGDNERYLSIERDDNTFYVRIGEECFYTEFNPGLCHILNKLMSAGSWGVKSGALVIEFRKGNKHDVVSFAEIVGTFFRGQIEIERPVESIIENHSKLSAGKENGKNIVYDHLTHNKQNNFPWTLAPIPETLNKQMQGRDRIRPPYFFNTIYDTTNKKFRVKFGVYGLWERRYLFDDLAYRNDDADVFTPHYTPADKKPGKDSLYATIYNKFKEKIGTENMGAKMSYLSYWADPERASKPGNMYTDSLSDPIETYRDAPRAWKEDGENLDDMPII